MTLTEPQTRRTNRRHSDPTPPYYMTTGEVLETTGLSFRVLDYWLRTGAIKLADGTTPGSGVSRRYTRQEVAAIQRLADRYNRATDEINSIRSGQAWATLTGSNEVIQVA